MLCFFFLDFSPLCFLFFFFNDTATTEIYTLSLHDALPICFLPEGARVELAEVNGQPALIFRAGDRAFLVLRSEEHTSELQSRLHLVCRLLLEKKKKKIEKTLTEERTERERLGDRRLHEEAC